MTNNAHINITVEKKVTRLMHVLFEIVYFTRDHPTHVKWQTGDDNRKKIKPFLS